MQEGDETNRQNLSSDSKKPLKVVNFSSEQPDKNNDFNGSSIIKWSAKDEVNSKTVKWQLLFLVIGIIISAITYLWTKDVIPTIAVALIVIIYIVSAGQKAKEITYELASEGILINDSLYKYSLFKSFSVIQDSMSGLKNIALNPLKRFTVPKTIFLDIKKEEDIINFLAQFLSYEERQQDVADKLASRLRF